MLFSFYTNLNFLVWFKKPSACFKLKEIIRFGLNLNYSAHFLCN
jgi:hypothetical protein